MRKALCVGLDSDCRKVVAALVPETDIIDRPLDLEKLAEEQITPPPGIVFCGLPPEGVSSIELAQLLSMQYQGAPTYYFVSNRQGFDRKALQKNGFTDGFLYPIDVSVVKTTVAEEIAKWGGQKVYKPVKLIDITPGVELDFDTFIYMPMNKKHIKFSAAGDPIDEERAKRLKEKSVDSMRVSSDQMGKFYEFTARQLKKLGSDKTMSETERKERMQNAVRDLMGGIFNDSIKEASTTHGKSIVSDAQEIVKAYVLDTSAQGGKNSWYERLTALSDQASNAYSHASAVSTFAALFSLGLGVGKPDELAIAGILHDIGLADVSPEIQMKAEEERAPHEKIAYNKHVDATLEIIRNRKLVVTDIVLKTIAQHHERYNGTGYPKGLVAERICKEAQILALADEFTYRLALGDGQPNKGPLEALAEIQKENAVGPKAGRFDGELLKALAALFPKGEERGNA